jgi:hypothetical protein
MDSPRRNGTPPVWPPGGTGDGLDEANWQILCEAVAAAHRGDADGAPAATQRFDTDVPVDGRAGRYIWWLLRHRVAQVLGRRPSRGDITQIAGYAEERFGALTGDVGLLKNVLLTVWKLATPREEVTAGMFLVAGTAARFRTQGLLEDRSGAWRRGRP